MKTRLHQIGLLLAVWLLHALNGLAQTTPQQLFDQAGLLYQHQQYDSATRIYQKLISDGYENAPLFYDAGNAYYQSGRLGMGIYYFEKAGMLAPGNPLIRHNLQFANQHIADHFESLPTLFFVSWGQQLLACFTPDGWVVFSLILFWLLLIFLGFRWMIPERRGWSSWMAIVCALLFAGGFYGALSGYHHMADPGYAIVLQPEVTVKLAPDNGSTEQFDIHEGLKVQILDTAGGWEKIRVEDGRTGWVSGTGVKPL